MVSSAVQSDAEAVDDGVHDREETGDQTKDRNEHVIAAFARERIEERRNRIAARESASVRVVVDAADREAHYHQHERVLYGVRMNHAAAALPPVVEHRAEETADGGRGAHRIGHADG